MRLHRRSSSLRSRLWRLLWVCMIGFMLSGLGHLENCGPQSTCQSNCCQQTSVTQQVNSNPCCSKPVPRTHCEAAPCCRAAEPDAALPLNPAESLPALQPLWTLVQGPPVPELNPEDPHRFAGFDGVRQDPRPVYARLNMLRC